MNDRFKRTAAAIAMVAAAIAIGACAGISTIGSTTGRSQVASGERVVDGDWDDVSASVAAAVRDQEVAILSEVKTDDVVTFELLTIKDEPGRLEARRGKGEAGGGESTITLTCRLGHFGDADRERALMDRTARRLKELAGVGAAPLGW